MKKVGQISGQAQDPGHQYISLVTTHPQKSMMGPYAFKFCFTCPLPLSMQFLLLIQSLPQLQILQKEWELLNTKVNSKWKTLIPSRMPEERPREEEALINLAASIGESSLVNDS